MPSFLGDFLHLDELYTCSSQRLVPTIMKLSSIFTTIASVVLVIVNAQSNGTNTYTNPIVPTGADPWVVGYEEYYYMINTTTDNITLWRSPTLTDWSDAESKAAFLPPVWGSIACCWDAS